MEEECKVGDLVEVEMFGKLYRGNISDISGDIAIIPIPDLDDAECECAEECPPNCDAHWVTKRPNAFRKLKEIRKVAV